MTLHTLEQAYIGLLRLYPAGYIRNLACTQATLAALRDNLARVLDSTPEEVQEDYERRAR